MARSSAVSLTWLIIFARLSQHRAREVIHKEGSFEDQFGRVLAVVDGTLCLSMGGHVLQRRHQQGLAGTPV